MNKQTGFTLLELLITIVVAATLISIGVPGVQEMLRNNQRAASTNELVGVINQVRSESIKRNTKVSVCPSTSGTACTGGTNWHNGWIAFVDDDLDNVAESSDGNGTWNTGEEIVDVTGPISNTTINSTFSSFTYRPNGRMRTSAATEQAEFILCDDRGVDKASVILIWISGRPQSTATDLDNNAPATCTPS